MAAELEAAELETTTPTRRKAVPKTRDSRVDSGSVDLETPLELSPKSPLEVLDEALSSVMTASQVEVIAVEKTKTASPVAPPRTRAQTTNGSAASRCFFAPNIYNMI
jgi:hypothetical protein